MAAYAITRRRTLRGMGATYSFLPRRRTLRGLGQDMNTDIDFVTGLPCDDPRANCGPDIFSKAGAVKPILPAAKTTPVAAPYIGPAIPGPVQLVFPAQATVPAPPKYAALPTVSWFDQQMIAGIPNSYLALGTVGLVLLVSMSSARRRR